MVGFIDDHRETFGVEPICTVLPTARRCTTSARHGIAIPAAGQRGRVGTSGWASTSIARGGRIVSSTASAQSGSSSRAKGRASPALPRRYLYRLLFLPGTIGSITWLALNQPDLHRIKHGLVLANAGDPGPLTCKKSRRSDAEVERAAINVLRHTGSKYSIREFEPYGYDERQYCSPGINLSVGGRSRTPHGGSPSTTPPTTT